MSFVRRPGEPLVLVTESSLEDSGFILTFSGVTTVGNVKKAVAGGTPVGINATSTEDPINPGTYLANVPVSITIEGVAYIRLSATNAAITVGDLLQSTAAAEADKLTVAALADIDKIIGIALEAKPANAGGKILALIKPRGM